MDKQAYELTEKIVKIIDSKKGSDITALDVSEVTPMTDCFVLCSGNSSTQVNAIADAIDEKLSEGGIEPHHIEGQRSGTWILMDYGSVIVHVMFRDTREYYNIERLWRDAVTVDISKIIEAEGEDHK